MLHTTFVRLHKAGACIESYQKLVRGLGGITKYGRTTPIPLDQIVEILNLQDALWALQCTIEPSDKLARLFACDCAWRVLPLYESNYPDDKRVRNCIEVARRFAIGEATKEELSAAGAAAGAAAWAAAWAVARTAAWTAWDAAWTAAWDAAGDAAGAAEVAWQTEHFLEMLRETK